KLVELAVVEVVIAGQEVGPERRGADQEGGVVPALGDGLDQVVDLGAVGQDGIGVRGPAALERGVDLEPGLGECPGLAVRESDPDAVGLIEFGPSQAHLIEHDASPQKPWGRTAPAANGSNAGATNSRAASVR